MNDLSLEIIYSILFRIFRLFNEGINISKDKMKKFVEDVEILIRPYDLEEPATLSAIVQKTEKSNYLACAIQFYIKKLEDYTNKNRLKNIDQENIEFILNNFKSRINIQDN